MFCTKDGLRMQLAAAVAVAVVAVVVNNPWIELSIEGCGGF